MRAARLPQRCAYRAVIQHWQESPIHCMAARQQMTGIQHTQLLASLPLLSISGAALAVFPRLIAIHSHNRCVTCMGTAQPLPPGPTRLEEQTCARREVGTCGISHYVRRQKSTARYKTPFCPTVSGSHSTWWALRPRHRLSSSHAAIVIVIRRSRFSSSAAWFEAFVRVSSFTHNRYHAGHTHRAARQAAAPHALSSPVCQLLTVPLSCVCSASSSLLSCWLPCG